MIFIQTVLEEETCLSSFSLSPCDLRDTIIHAFEEAKKKDPSFNLSVPEELKVANGLLIGNGVYSCMESRSCRVVCNHLGVIYDHVYEAEENELLVVTYTLVYNKEPLIETKRYATSDAAQDIEAYGARVKETLSQAIARFTGEEKHVYPKHHHFYYHYPLMKLCVTFLGLFGVHHFMLGEKKRGIGHLACWLFPPLVFFRWICHRIIINDNSYDVDYDTYW